MAAMQLPECSYDARPVSDTGDNNSGSDGADGSNVTLGVSGHFGTSDDLVETIPIPNNNLPTSMKDSMKRQGLMPGDLPTSAEVRSDSHPAGASRKTSPILSEKFWKKWEEKFINYARPHIGSNGIPLS